MDIKLNRTFRRKSFGERNGYSDVPAPLNPGEISQQLRIEFDYLLSSQPTEGLIKSKLGKQGADWEKIFEEIWIYKFGKAYVSNYILALCSDEIKRVIAYGDFSEVFSLIEEIALRIKDSQPSFQEEINAALIRNQSPYILHKSSEMGWVFIQTGSNQEKETAVKCLEDLKDPYFSNARAHFEKAGSWLFKEEFPESVSQSAKALEACVKKLINKPDVTGGSAIEFYAKETKLPPRIKQLMLTIWGYRNEAEDVGHSKKDNAHTPPPDRWEAQLIYGLVPSVLSYLVNKRRERS
jgi:hypothetical protein